MRFAVISLSIILYLNPTVSFGSSLLVVWPALASLALSAAYFFAGSDRDKFYSLRGFLIFGKVLDILPGLLLLMLQSVTLHFGLGDPLFDRVPIIEELIGEEIITELAFYYGLAIIVLLDLIFLLILLSYRTDPLPAEPAPGENLPDYEITQIEED